MSPVPAVSLAAALLTLTLALCAEAGAAPGDPDRSFRGGKVTTSLGKEGGGATATALQRDGKIVVISGTGSITDSDVVLVRYNANGSVDGSFGSGGKRRTDLGGADEARDVAVQPDGKILVAGQSDGDLVLVRYNPDGTLDTSFGTGGTGSSGSAACAPPTSSARTRSPRSSSNPTGRS
jgi:uncharacterized delta-60 repeat protein